MQQPLYLTIVDEDSVDETHPDFDLCKECFEPRFIHKVDPAGPHSFEPLDVAITAEELVR